MFYSEKTTNQNRSTNPTPYICLKSRLLQIIWNDNIHLGVLLMLLTSIFSETFQSILRWQYTVSSSSVTVSDSNNHLSSILESKSISINIPYLSGNLSSDQIDSHLDMLLSTLDNIELSILTEVNSTYSSIWFSINGTIESAYISRIDRTELEEQFNTFISNINSTLYSNFEAQDAGQEDLKKNIEDSAVYIGSSINLDLLGINFTWIGNYLSEIKNNISFGNDNEEQYYFNLYEKKSIILSQLDKIKEDAYRDTLSIFEEYYANITETIHGLNVERINLQLLSDASQIVYSTASNEITTSTNGSTSTSLSKSPNKSEDKLEEETKSILIILGVISLLVIPIQFCWQWLRFKYEQKQLQNLSNDFNDITDQLSLVFRTVDFEAFKIADIVCKIFNMNGSVYEVKIYWLSSFWFSFRSTFNNLTKVFWVLGILYIILSKFSSYLLVDSTAITSGDMLTHQFNQTVLFEINIDSFTYSDPKKTDFQQIANDFKENLLIDLSNQFELMNENLGDFLLGYNLTPIINFNEFDSTSLTGYSWSNLTALDSSEYLADVTTNFNGSTHTGFKLESNENSEMILKSLLSSIKLSFDNSFVLLLYYIIGLLISFGIGVIGTVVYVSIV